MSFRRVAFAVFGAAAVAAAAGSCSSTTEVVIVVDGDVRGADTVVLSIDAPGFSKEKTAKLAETPFPLTLGVEAGGDDGAAFTVRAVAKRGDLAVVTRVARTAFVSGESKVLLLSLCDACAGVTCAGDTTCGDTGTCDAIFDRPAVDPWTGTPPKHACAAPPTNDGGIDAAVDAAVDADAGLGPPTTLPDGYHLIEEVQNWSAMDLATIAPKLVGYLGATVTGGYLYLAPSNTDGARHGNVVRLDTAKPFDAASSWETFDVTTVASEAKGFAGASTFAAADGFPAFVYLTPYEPSTGDVVARYRTDAAFSAKSSWETIALETFPPTLDAGGFGGAVVNRSHIWLPTRTPTRPFALHSNRDAENPSRLIDAGWETFDPRTIDGGAAVSGGYFGGAYDDAAQRMYFAPARAAGAPHGIAITHAIGSKTTGWSAFDLASIDGDLRGYAGGVFDGRFVYFVPLENANGAHGHVVRYDTAKPFTSAASWERIDLATIDPKLVGFLGGVFDGRFVTLVPNAGSIVARYDTTGAFGDAASWSRLDLTKAGGPSAAKYAGGAFDGKFVYLVPTGHSPVLRFDARRSADLGILALSHGSFL